MITTPDGSNQSYWQQIHQEAPLVAIRKSEEAAKQLISLTALLSTLYFGIIAFNQVPIQNASGLSILLFALPLPIWIGSLFFATRVILPRPYNIDDEIRTHYIVISQKKYLNLWWSYALLVISMCLLLLNVITYLLFVPLPSP